MSISSPVFKVDMKLYTMFLRVYTVLVFIEPFFFINFDNSSLITIGNTSILWLSASLGIAPFSVFLGGSFSSW